jgi:DNA mismatch repair protein MutL
MSKIRVLSDHIANQIAAGEVVERPASVAKELVENSIDAGARRVEVDVEGGGRSLLRVADDGEGMTRDDAVLAFERHATSKISATEDLARIRTLGFRGEALASIASVARIELVTQNGAEVEGTRVLVEGGRMRDVAPAARPVGTTIAVRDLFFNVPARRKFLRSEATESFHLTNLITHYALAHPEIAFTLTSNGREVLRAAPAADLRERAYQIFGAEFLEGLLEVGGGHEGVARVGGYVSAPRERRSTRDAQYLFVNGRFVRDRLVMRGLSEGYRSVLPQGSFPAALLFLEVPLEEVDVNVHPAKTEVRFRRPAAVAEAVREAVRAALAAGGYLRTEESLEQGADARGSDATGEAAFAAVEKTGFADSDPPSSSAPTRDAASSSRPETPDDLTARVPSATLSPTNNAPVVRNAERGRDAARQEEIELVWTPHAGDPLRPEGESLRPDAEATETATPSASALDADARSVQLTSPPQTRQPGPVPSTDAGPSTDTSRSSTDASRAEAENVALPPLDSAAGFVREAAPGSLTPNIHPLGQFGDSFIVAADAEGLLLIDQHVAHERILFDKYRALEASRTAESQNLLVPETFDLSPAQAAAFDAIAPQLERYGFSLMRLSGRTVAVRAVPADLPAGEARNLLAELLTTMERGRREAARETLGERVAAALASRAAIKSNTPLTQEKMRWLIDRLLRTSSPTTCPHGRPIILRLTKRDIERGFRRT